MKKNLIFTGIKHSGKTTQARLVSTFLSLPIYDTDDLILEDTGEESVRDYYKTHGKDAFMAEEVRVYNELRKRETRTFVLSLGGGASDNTELMDEVRKDGFIIYIKRPEDVLLRKILRGGVPPFLDENDIEGSFHALYSRRDGVYSSYADMTVSLGEYSDKRETALKIIDRLREEGYEW